MSWRGRGSGAGPSGGQSARSVIATPINPKGPTQPNIFLTVLGSRHDEPGSSVTLPVYQGAGHGGRTFTRRKRLADDRGLLRPALAALRGLDSYGIDTDVAGGAAVEEDYVHQTSRNMDGGAHIRPTHALVGKPVGRRLLVHGPVAQ